MTPEQQLNMLAKHCSTAMDEIKNFFQGHVEVTVMVRSPGKPERDFMMSNDDLDELTEMVQRAKDRAAGKVPGMVKDLSPKESDNG